MHGTPLVHAPSPVAVVVMAVGQRLLEECHARRRPKGMRAAFASQVVVAGALQGAAKAVGVEEGVGNCHQIGAAASFECVEGRH